MAGRLPARFFCAPMAELSTPALRGTIREFSGDAVLCSEMLSAGAVASRAPHNEPLLRKLECDDPFIYQIVGSRPDVMAEACAVLSARGCYAIDLNMGCAAPEIIKTGAGARLLSDAGAARRVVRACRKATPVKLSVKMRAGFDDADEARLVDFARMLEDEGVDFITLHGRHARIGFRRSADWSLVALLKRRTGLPVIGNGDIDSPETAFKRLDETGCDAVMIGRAAVRSPWIFRLCELLAGSAGGSLPVDVRGGFIRTLESIRDLLPPHLHKSRGHRFCFYYSRNARFAHALFTRIRKEAAVDAMIGVVRDYYERNPVEEKKILRVEGNTINEVDEI